MGAKPVCRASRADCARAFNRSPPGRAISPVRSSSSRVQAPTRPSAPTDSTRAPWSAQSRTKGADANSELQTSAVTGRMTSIRSRHFHKNARSANASPPHTSITSLGHFPSLDSPASGPVRPVTDASFHILAKASISQKYTNTSFLTLLALTSTLHVQDFAQPWTTPFTSRPNCANTFAR